MTLHDTPDDEPIVRAKLLRLLEERPRAIDYGARKKILREVRENVEKRREPDEFAGRIATSAVRGAEEVAIPALQGTVRSGLELGNRTILSGK